MGLPTVTPLAEDFHDGGFLVSRELGSYSVDQVTLLTGQKYKAGSVVGKITASGKYTMWNPANSDGSQTVAGILYATKDATAADKPGVVVNRVAQVNASELVWFTGATGGNITTGLAGLKAIGLIPR